MLGESGDVLASCGFREKYLYLGNGYIVGTAIHTADKKALTSCRNNW